ncbi:complement factor H-like [Heptranchias perlo]|uniref:complement factor H-like n=1 Tax=Heptranchias perlo TaxID=212740 RepID=UPI00355A9740
MKLTAFVYLLVIFDSCTGAFLNKRDCEPPLNIDNAWPVLTSAAESYPNGTEINYNCEPGYVGRLRYKCIDGEWKNTHRKFYCKPKPCGSPGDTMHGTFQLVKGDDLVFGARIEYTCDEGYQLVGTKNYRECKATGWSGLVPFCEVKTCSPVKEPENGKIIVSGMFDLDQDFPYGSALQFECNSPKLEIQGAKEIHCLANRTWSDAVPKCIEFECKKPTITNGQVLNEGVFKYSQNLEYKCNRNFRPGGTQLATCTKFGWSPLPICSSITCTITQIEHGKFLSTKWMYSHGETVKYSCDTNHKPLGSATVECQASGWTPNPSCIEIMCFPPNIDATFDSRRWSFRIWEQVTYHCRTSGGRQQSTCLAGGWSPPIKCHDSCSRPSNIPNGYFLHSKTSYRSGEKVRYRCHDWYALQGGEEIECIDGLWYIKGSVPVCIETGCKKPPAVRNVNFSPDRERYQEGQWLTYSCVRGYELHGKQHVQCGSKGWLETSVCIDKKSVCMAPPEVYNAYIRDKKNSKVRYRCNDGYEMEGLSEIVCINGNWSLAPTCNDPMIPCDRPPAVANGDTIDITRSTYKHGDKVTYQCQNYYVLKGASEVKCIGGEWSTPPDCIAPCTVTEEDFTNNGILLRWSLERFLYVKHGDVLEFVCPNGFEIETPAKRFCQNGRMQIPKCINNERKYCTELRYFECPLCASSEICVEFHIQRISSTQPNPSTLMLTAQSGTSNALFKVQNIRERNGNILKFSIKESSDTKMNIRFSNEPRSIQFDNPAIGDYCLTFPTGNSIMFNVTFSGNFSIRFNSISQNLG